MWKNFKTFYQIDCKIWTFELTKILFLALKKMGSYTSQGHIQMKNVQNGGVSLDSFFKES